MSPALSANVATNLRFYRRNRLLLAIGLLLLAIWILSILPGLLYSTGGQHFQLVQSFVTGSAAFVNLLVAALGVLSVHHHISGRSLKMVLTRPCPVETWYASQLASALLVSATLHLAIFAGASALVLAWGIPWQWGMLYVAFDGVLRSAVLFSVLTFLTVVVHPFVAILVAGILNDGTVGQLIRLNAVGLKTSEGAFSHALLTFNEVTLTIVYFFLPAYSPFESKTLELYSTFRAGAADFLTLGKTFLYAAAVTALFYFLAVTFLRRKRLT